MRSLKILCVFLSILAITTYAYAELKLRVAATNPSATNVKTTKVKIYLPQEVTPGDIIDNGGLDLEFDDTKSIYYVHKDDVELNPKETRVFEVVIKDIWLIPEDELSFARRRTSRILDRLKESQYYKEAVPIAQTVYDRLEEVAIGQADETISRESHIGLYRTNLEVMKKVGEDIDRLEKLLVYVGGPPAPELLEESSLKADAPSKTTTWLIIFIIMGFVGVIAVVFFFTWHRQAEMTEKVMLNAREMSFPDEGEETEGGEEEKTGKKEEEK